LEKVAPTRSVKQRPIPANTPLVIRTFSDVLALSASPAQLKRLPQNGLVVDVPGLDERSRQSFRRQIKRYVRACGCSAAGATFLLGSAASVAYAARFALSHAWIELGLTIVAGMVLTPSLAVAAKFLALRFARQRFRRSCALLIRLLSDDTGARDSGRTTDVLSGMGG
jgi:hypothetical protein